MKLAFLALRGCCDYESIGGAESLARRLAQGITLTGHSCDYVLYGYHSASERLVDKKIRLRYSTSFKEALLKLKESYDHIVMINISPRDRPAFFRFQRARRQKKIRFYKMMLGTPQSILKWLTFLLEALILTKGGKVLTISAQTRAVLRKFRIASTLLLPPVPESYFVPATQKNKASSLMLTYLGRLDEEKGSSDMFDFFNYLRDFDEIHTQVYGYRWDHDKAKLKIEHYYDGQVSESIIDPSELIYKPELEEKIQRILRDTDILVLPYHSTKGTIDPPLLLLEGMASSCAILTRHVGNTPLVYGESRFIIRESNFSQYSFEFVKKIRDNRYILKDEQQRIADRTASLSFNTKSIANKFIASLIK